MPLKLQASMWADEGILRGSRGPERKSRCRSESYYWKHFKTEVHGSCYFEWEKCCKIFMGCGESRMYLLGKCSVERIGCLALGGV